MEDIKYIDCIKRVVQYEGYLVKGKEITSYDDFKKLYKGAVVAVLTLSFKLMTVDEINEDYAYIKDDVESMRITKESFKYGNFMYKVISIR